MKNSVVIAMTQGASRITMLFIALTFLNFFNYLHVCLENSMDRGAWGVIVHGVAKSQTEL